MKQLHMLAPADFAGLARFAPADGLAEIPVQWETHRPEVHCFLEDAGRIRARASIWYENGPKLEGRHLGVIGHFTAVDAEAAETVLDHSVEWLRARGADLVLGPMDGNTWRRYRFVTASSGRAPFFLEPTNPPEFPDYWRAAGFAPWSEYQSIVASGLRPDDPRFGRPRELRDGLRVRSLDLERFAEELRSIHALSLAAFTSNHFYAPLPEADFLALYLPLQTRVRPEFVLLAEEGERLVAYAFAVPDFAGDPTRTLILKTAAVHPDFRRQGLGMELMRQIHERAARAGFDEVIHALSAVDNPVVGMSGQFGDVFRRYTLFGRELEQR